MELEDGRERGGVRLSTERLAELGGSPAENEKLADTGTEKNEKKNGQDEHEKNSDDTSSESTEKEKERKSKEMVPLYKLFAFADSVDVLLMILGTIGAVGSGVSQPLMTMLFGRIVDAFGKNANDLDKLLAEVSEVAFFYVISGVGAAVASCFEVTCWMITGERQASRIRGLYLKAILRQDVSFFDQEVSSGDVEARMSEDTVLIQDAMGEKVGNAVQLWSRFLGGFIIAFTGSWKLALVLIAVVPVITAVGGILGKRVSTLTIQGQHAYTEAGSIVAQVLGAVRTVASYGGEKKAVEAYDKALEKAESAGVRLGLAAGVGMGTTLFVMFNMYGMSLWYGSRLVADTSITAGQVINVIFAVVMGGMALGQMSPCLTAFASGRAAGYKMFQVIYRKSQIDGTDLNGEILEKIKGDIELRDVTFAYPTRSDVPILRNFSLVIPSGTTAALVGESGSGKSSVISLVERFYDPQAGKVLLDGVDIKIFQLKWLRQQIALVSQEPVLFSTSIMQNIAYGKDGATLEEVQAAAKASNASSFIAKLPKGYETQVGERGTQLSGGQKQRIAIARAILKDPRILLLDEATSALDADSEHLVQEALDRVMINRTTVLVAHRLSTIKTADMIAVIRNGTILEFGTHEELIKNPDGGYSQLIRLQALQQTEVDEKVVSESSVVVNDEEKEKLERTSNSQSTRIFSRGSSMNSTGFVSILSRASSTFRKSLSRKLSANMDMELGIDSERAIDNLTGDDMKEGSFWRLAKMNKPEAPYFVLGSLGSIGHGLLLPTFGFLLSAFIELLFKPPREIRKEGGFLALMFVALSTVTLISTPTQRWCFAIVGSSLVRRVRKETFSRVLCQEMAWFDEDQNSSGAISGRLYTDAGAVKSVVGDTLLLIIQNITTISAGLIIAFSSGWELAFVVLGLIPLLGMQGVIAAKRIKGFAKSAKKNYENASQVANDAVSNIRTVASFCAEDKVVDIYEEQCKNPVKNGVKRGLVSGVSVAFGTFTLFSAYALGFWAGAKLVVLGRITPEVVFRVFLSISMSAVALTQSFTMAPDLAKAQAAVTSIFGILDRKSKIDPTNKEGQTLDTLKGLIEFRHVHFRYPARPDVTVLQDLSFILPAGQTLALVGESGSGKSTVIALLERFYEPESGSILIDNVEVRTMQLEWLRKKMALVSQEPILFDGSIRMNITYGNEAATEHEMLAAACSANAHKFIASLADAYETRIGDKGIKLSGGQKQRVAIARAIVKDPSILLLDEATSALDAESEQVVQEALDQISAHRTTVIVAHRLTTVRNASQIAVLKNGTIVETGTYDQLTSRPNSAFSALVKLSNNVHS